MAALSPRLLAAVACAVAAVVLLRSPTAPDGSAAGCAAAPCAQAAQTPQRSFLPLSARNALLPTPIPPPATQTPTPSPSPTPDRRFAVAVQTATSDAAVQHMLDATGISSWYSWGGPSAAGPAGRVQLLSTGPGGLGPDQDPVVQSVAQARPGSYWIVGSEPNVPGPSQQSGADYAASYRHYRSLILAADPTAHFVVGNALNLDANCGGCSGYPPGRGFLDAFVAAYSDPIPSDTIWGIHAYRIDWNALPMVETAEPERELQSFRAYVDGLPGQANKPIWLTEFGVVWGYPSFCYVGDKISNCGAPFAADQVEAYLTTLADWLRANGPALRIERWFVFSSYANPESFALVPGGIALMDGPSETAQLTRYGRAYAARATARG